MAAFDCPFADLIQSDLFTFYIGAQKKPFIAHSKAIAATSEPFRALVTGGLSESKTRSAELHDIEPEDLIRFLEYAYRGDYTVPPWTPDGDTEVLSDFYADVPEPKTPAAVDAETPSPPPAAALDLRGPPSALLHREDWGTAFGAPCRKKKGKLSSDEVRSIFQRRAYLSEQAPGALLRDGYEPKPNTDATQDYTPVFPAHARLYTFASMYMIEPLKDLALHKLHKTLVGFELCPERVRDVVELVGYAYDNGPGRTEQGKLDGLRRLVVEYVACEVESVGSDEDFQGLLEVDGEFVTDFWNTVWGGWS